MKPVKYNFSPLSNQSPLGLLERLFEGEFPGKSSEIQRAFRADVIEKKDAYEVHLEAPGFSQEDLEIELHEGVLSVKAQKEREETTKEENYLKMERSFGSFQRSFYIPENVVEDQIEASSKDGVLTLRLPKSEEEVPKSRRIEVKAA